jgi:hypothetical protein
VRVESALSFLTRVVNSACASSCGETFTATENGRGTASQSANRSTMRSNTSHVSGTMMPVVSASGMKSLAGTKFPASVRQRTSASTPETRRVAISILG